LTSARDPNRCRMCARKLGLMKAYLVCDDCGLP
jgi:ribosomal protein S14